MLVPDVNVQRQRMLVTKIAKTVTNIFKLSPTHFVSNIRHQHRCSRIFICNLNTYRTRILHIFFCGFFKLENLKISVSDKISEYLKLNISACATESCLKHLEKIKSCYGLKRPPPASWKWWLVKIQHCQKFIFSPFLWFL